MENFNFLKFFKTWLLSLAGFNLFVFLYLVLVGRVMNESYGADLIGTLGILVLISSVIIGVVNVIYAIVKKNTPYIFMGLGTIGLSVMLWVWLVIMALSTIW